MSGQQGSSAKRRLKRERRMRMTMEEVMNEIMVIMRSNGYSILTAEDIPEVLRAAFSNPVQAETIIRHEVPLNIDVQVHIGNSDDDLFDELEDEFDVIDVPASAPRAQKQIQEHLPELDMVEEYKRRQSQLMERISTEGVHYRGAPGPAEGQRIAPHPSVVANFQTQTSPSTQEGSQGPRRATLGPGPIRDEAEVSTGGRVNPHTGLTAEESRRLVERATGRPVPPPAPGAPNTLKS